MIITLGADLTPTVPVELVIVRFTFITHFTRRTYARVGARVCRITALVREVLQPLFLPLWLIL